MTVTGRSFEVRRIAHKSFNCWSWWWHLMCSLTWADALRGWVWLIQSMIYLHSRGWRDSDKWKNLRIESWLDSEAEHERPREIHMENEIPFPSMKAAGAQQSQCLIFVLVDFPLLSMLLINITNLTQNNRPQWKAIQWYQRLYLPMLKLPFPKTTTTKLII